MRSFYTWLTLYTDESCKVTISHPLQDYDDMIIELWDMNDDGDHFVWEYWWV